MCNKWLEYQHQKSFSADTQRVTEAWAAKRQFKRQDISADSFQRGIQRSCDRTIYRLRIARARLLQRQKDKNSDNACK